MDAYRLCVGISLQKIFKFLIVHLLMLSRREHSMKIKFESDVEKNPDDDIENAIDNTRNWALSIIKVKHNGEIPDDEKEEVERILNKFRLTSYAKLDRLDN